MLVYHVAHLSHTKIHHNIRWEKFMGKNGESPVSIPLFNELLGG